MRTTHWVMTAILGLLLTSCAGISTAPTAAGRQALAPAGKLRVGLQLGSPHNVIRDSASGEMKGVGFDLGKELAAHKFIEDAKSEGLVKAAIERAGLRGVIVAPLK